MSGHNKWTQIKHQKGAVDQKRARLFSKILSAISVIAKTDSNPSTNQKLKSAIQKAKEVNVPLDNINRAINRNREPDNNLEELFIEAYGPGGAAILIEAITDNRNRTVAEIKKILSDHEGKWGNPGSVRWVFEKSTADEGPSWIAKFFHPADKATTTKTEELLDALEEHGDVQNVFSNITPEPKTL